MFLLRFLCHLVAALRPTEFRPEWAVGPTNLSDFDFELVVVAAEADY